MTPKEKATQLCDAFYQKLPLEMYVTTTDGDLSWEYNSWKNSKECAIIAVDEIIESVLPSSDFGGNINKNTVEYWTEVKQEIEKL
jgi:hypothetical protein